MRFKNGEWLMTTGWPAGRNGRLDSSDKVCGKVSRGLRTGYAVFRAPLLALSAALALLAGVQTAAADSLDARASFREIPAYSAAPTPPSVWEFDLKGPARYRVRVNYAPWYRNAAEMVKWRSRYPIDGRDFGAWVEFIPGAETVESHATPERWVDAAHLEKVAVISIRKDQPGMQLSINPPTVRFGDGSVMQLKGAAEVIIEPIGATAGAGGGGSGVGAPSSGVSPGPVPAPSPAPVPGAGSQAGSHAGAAAPAANLALHKPSFASRSYGAYGPGQGNDGNPGSIWNGGGHEACWAVDLQGVYPVQRIVVHSNQFGAGALKTIFQVSSSINNAQWSAIGAPITASGDQSFALPTGGARMRYVRYCTLAGSTNWATLSELAVYGVPGARP